MKGPLSGAAALAGALCLSCFSAGSAGELRSFTMPSSLTYGGGTDAGGTVQGVLRAEPQLEFDFSPGVSMVLSGRLWLDAEDRLEPGRVPRDTYATLSRPMALGTSGSAELRDFHLELRSDNGITRLGKQQIVWGRLDGIKVLDLVNPQDFREFILDDFDQSRIGLWSAYLDYSFGPWRTELAFVPDGTGHVIPNSGAWFELSAPRFRFGADPGNPTPRVVTDRPGHKLADAALGLRVSRQFDIVDVSAVAYTGLDPEPLGRLERSGNETLLRRFYERREAFGFSAEGSVGALALRAEYAYQPDRVFNVSEGGLLDTVSLDQHRAAVGVDWNAPFDLFVNAQFLLDSIRGAPAGLVRPDTDRIATVFLRRNFAYETLAVELRWYHELERHDDMGVLTVEYRLTDDTRIRLSAEAFSGTAEGLFGQFSGSDRITLGIEHTF